MTKLRDVMYILENLPTPQCREKPRIIGLKRKIRSLYTIINKVCYRLATACGWPQKQWAQRLAGLLTGKARQAYATMPIMECQDCSQVKAAILAKYEINAESYHRRFQEAQVKKGETPKEFYTRLHEILEQWLKQGEQPIDVIVEQLLMEQYLRVCSPGFMGLYAWRYQPELKGKQ
ncbi:hypothetical protein EOD39_12150 [Acipenser ruthenus]|uniref:SCAN box domain-containing protein n=1 Tax=Acipenser ruthenus TaxID=7906 RepID=A0A444ULX3_ACIRT|nr:hypothetical protein EOD39_12150 [Acipenser ruthenus]